MNKPKWGSSFYEGAAEAAKQEADEAAKFDFRGRAAQLAMAARDIAALESINAELARRAQKAERERDEARRQVAAFTELAPTAPEGGEWVTITIDVDQMNAAPAVQCIRCNAPCSECATPPTEREE